MNETAYERVKLARDNKRPTGLDYIKNIFAEFIELHGDRRYADDPAIVGGIAKLNETPVTVLTIEKGHTAKERAYRNFGAPHPEGYRKALRLMKQAEKFGRPNICFVDTSGAYCGVGAEERPVIGDLGSHAAHGAGAHGGHGVEAELRGLAVAADLREAGGETAQGPQTHPYAGGDVAAGIYTVGGDYIVGHCRAHVDHQQVAPRQEAPGADSGGDAVLAEGLRCGIPYLHRHGGVVAYLDRLHAHTAQPRQYLGS